MEIHPIIKNTYYNEHSIFNKKMRINITTPYRLPPNYIQLVLDKVNVSISFSQPNKNDYLLYDKFTITDTIRLVEEMIKEIKHSNYKSDNNLIEVIPYACIEYYKNHFETTSHLDYKIDVEIIFAKFSNLIILSDDDIFDASKTIVEIMFIE